MTRRCLNFEQARIRHTHTYMLVEDNLKEISQKVKQEKIDTTGKKILITLRLIYKGKKEGLCKLAFEFSGVVWRRPILALRNSQEV